MHSDDDRPPAVSSQPAAPDVPQLAAVAQRRAERSRPATRQGSDLNDLRQRARAAGLRELTGRYLTLFTDRPADDAVDVLPEVFDQAFLQWCRYFGVSRNKKPPWRMIACLMVDRQRFAAAGLVPDDLPEFLHGYTLGDRFWMNDQPTDYYRRHLMLHEGTHGFMNSRLGGCGPPWYMEGIAELMATHRWEETDGRGQLELNRFPADRDDVPYWGRIKIVKESYAGGGALGLLQIMQTDYRAFLRNEPYGWCWAAAAFLDGHPEFQRRFRKLPEHVTAADFNAQLLDEFADDRTSLLEQWQVFVANLEYGYDLERMAVEFRSGEPLAEGEQATRTLAADRGWQSAGVRVETGENYTITASGRYQIALTEDVWWCEPGGVTIRYYGGLPLGILVGTVRPDDWNGTTTSALLNPSTIGLENTLTPEQTGTLYLRVNDTAAELHDNDGSLEVVIRRK